MGNDDSCEMTSIGAIKFKLANGFVEILGDVRLVPKLRRNLISLGLLDSSDYMYKIEKCILKITKF